MMAVFSTSLTPCLQFPVKLWLLIRQHIILPILVVIVYYKPTQAFTTNVKKNMINNIYQTDVANRLFINSNIGRFHLRLNQGMVIHVTSCLNLLKV